MANVASSQNQIKNQKYEVKNKKEKSPVETRDVIHMRKLNFFLISTAYPALLILGSTVSAALRRLLNIFSKTIGEAERDLANVEFAVDLCVNVSVFGKSSILLPSKRIANIQPDCCFVLQNIFLASNTHLVDRLVNGQLIDALPAVKTA